MIILIIDTFKNTRIVSVMAAVFNCVHQVTDMMVANSANLIVTVKPVNQRNNVSVAGGIGSTRSSVKSTASYLSAKSHLSARDASDEITHMVDSEDYDEDVVQSHLTLTSVSKSSSAAGDNVLATL